ncbi:MAG: replication-associated recombination protein A, partial [Cucumibacter sp.]
MSDLFGADKAPPASPPGDRPLADRLRPQSLNEVVGQDHLLGQTGALRRMIGSGRLGSMIF